MKLRYYISFDSILRNNNYTSFYDIYYRLRCLRVTSRGWKSSTTLLMNFSVSYYTYERS